MVMNKTGIILLGQYRPADSYLHRLDTRAKMVPVVLVLLLSLFTQSYIFSVGSLALLLAALLHSGVSRETLTRSFRPMWWLVGVTFLYHLIFSGKGSELLFNI